ncbi:hypothetical protein BYT27DRAFT_7236065 [Phlegmacium glaucopus]|nr:hypothetical protein BYT27DRAFT_7236065 [Phlegmacium glaucopus]
MPSILNLKFKGNKSFVAFSNLNDTESLTKTWKVCTKVASYLEQGQRLENLSWRLWHLQNLMVDTDNAKSKREFKKLSKCMGDKLDKEKGRSIEELEAPDFKRNHNTDMIRQRAVEKERNREASQNAQPGIIKRMQFTFSVDQQVQQAPSSIPTKKPDTRPSAEFTKRTRAAASRAQVEHEDTIMTDGDTTTTVSSSNSNSASTSTTTPSSSASLSSQFLHFPPLFGTGFGPSALLYAAPTLTNPMNYGEGFNPSGANESFSISRPTIELPLDEILFNDDVGTAWCPPSEVVSTNTTTFSDNNNLNNTKRKNGNTNSAAGQQDVMMQSVSAPAAVAPIVISLPKKSTSSSTSLNKTDILSLSSSSSMSSSSSDEEEEEEEEYVPTFAPAPSSSKRNSVYKNIPPLSQTVKEVLPETVTPSRLTSSIYGTRSNTPTARPHLTVRTQGTVNTRSSGPGATATSLNPAVLRGGGSGSGSGSGGSSGGNSAPGGVKAECSNCGATHTPLWRRGLNDELNCNACGLYCKLHKRPRPKSMRNSHGEGRAQVVPRQETVDVIVAAQCYNCHTTATPLWRKDDEGKTVCNACGLYYKLHGSARPISMKSDVIRKRSRHDARRASINGPEDTPSTSPGPSRRASPVREASPTLAPDSTTQLSYDFGEDSESFRAISAPSASELMGALGSLTSTGVVSHVGDTAHGGLYQTPPSPYNRSLSSALTSSSSAPLYPGPYHPDYLLQLYNVPGDALPFSSVDSVEIDVGMSPRSNKRRRMSTDSTEDPPSSAVSFASYSAGDGGYSSSATSSSSHGHPHSLSHAMSHGHSHSFSLTHNHSHSLSSHVHSHSLSHSHSHAKRSSMEFPFSTYNANGTINQGPVLRGSGNTFWHPPMLPQTGSDNESHLFNPHGGNSSNNNKNNNSNNNSNDGGGNGSSGRNAGGNNEDSAMDYLHPPPMLQDEDSLFSAYVHPPMALPEDAGQSGGEGNDGNMHTSMYVDSYY